MMCLICSLKPACEAGEAGGDGKTKTWCRNLISAVPCCAYAHMPGQSDYGTLDRRHQAERETARYIVLRSTQYWRVLILKDTAKPCRMKKRNVRPYYIYNSTFGLALALFSLHSSLIWSFSMPDGQDFCHFHFSSLCAPHVVSPRDLWLCVLPRWQFNVNVNVNSW
jgi:hypothetical protein